MKRINLLGATCVILVISPMVVAQSFSVYEVGFQPVQGLPTDLYRFDTNGLLSSHSNLPETQEGISMTTTGGSLFIAAAGGPINKYDLAGMFSGQFANVASQAGDQAIVARLESDSAGSIYVAYDGTGSAPRTSFRLNSNGAISQTFSHPQLLDPIGIDAAANHDVYIVDTLSNKLFRFTSSGTFVANYALPQLDDPVDLSIDEARNFLYIADFFGDSILKYNISSGAPVFVTSIAVPGRAEDVFVEPTTGQVFGTFSPSGLSTFSGFESPAGGGALTLFNANVPSGEDLGQILAIAVPEPTTAMLLLLGMLGCGWRRR